MKQSNSTRISLARVAAACMASALAAASLAFCTSNNDSAGSQLSSGGSDTSDAGGVSWPQPADASAAPGDGSAASPEGVECSVDSDCVPQGCCHPATCVAVSPRPSCEGVMCTMNCQPGTLDCGGSCLCQAGRCAARFAMAPIEIDAGISTPDASAPDAAVDAGRRGRRR